MKLGDDLLALDELVDLTPEGREPLPASITLPASIKKYIAYMRCMHGWCIIKLQ